MSNTVVERAGLQVVYVLAGYVFTLCVGLPLQIYISRVLGADLLGVYGLLDGVVSTVAGFCGFGIAQTALRFIPAHLERKEYSSIRRLIVVGGSLLLGAGIAGYLLVLLGLDVLSLWWPALAPFRMPLVLMALMIPLSLVLYFLQQVLRGFQDVRYITAGSSIMQLTVKAAVVVAAFGLGLKLLGYVAATILSALCAVMWMAYGVTRKLSAIEDESGAVDESDWSQWRRYAMISFAWSMIGAATVNLDRFLLGFFTGSIAVGVLLVVRQLQQLPVLFNTVLLMVTAPMFSAAQARSDIGERQHLYWITTDWVVRASLPLVLFLFVFGRPLLGLFGPQFSRDGLLPLYILVAAQFFNLACGPVGNIAWMCGLEGISLKIWTVISALTALLLCALIPPFGLMGAAIASACGIVSINLVELVITRRRLGMRWRDRRFLGWIFPACGALLIGEIIRPALFFPDGPVIEVSILLTVAIIVMYATFFLLNLLQGLHEDDKLLLRRFRSLLLPAR